MADEDKQLMTSRLTNASSGGLIDDAFRDVEAALRLILGVPADTVMAAAMAIAANGDVTFQQKVTLSADPTADLEAATKQYVDAVARGGVTSYFPVTGEVTFSSTSLSNYEWPIPLYGSVANLGYTHFRVSVRASQGDGANCENIGVSWQDATGTELDLSENLNENVATFRNYWSDLHEIPDTSAQLIQLQGAATAGNNWTIEAASIALVKVAD